MARNRIATEAHRSLLSDVRLHPTVSTVKSWNPKLPPESGLLLSDILPFLWIEMFIICKQKHNHSPVPLQYHHKPLNLLMCSTLSQWEGAVLSLTLLGWPFHRLHLSTASLWQYSSCRECCLFTRDYASTQSKWIQLVSSKIFVCFFIWMKWLNHHILGHFFSLFILCCFFNCLVCWAAVIITRKV